MDDNVILSIIVPIYNVEKYLEECIKSILKQTYNSFELILIDDGSTDSSGKIADYFLSIDKRVKVIHQCNKGLSSARNIGIEISSGKYIMLVDSDDVIDYRMCEIMVNNAEENNADLVICDFLEFSSNIIYTNNINIKSEKFNNIEALEGLTDKFRSKFTISTNKLYRKRLLEKNKFMSNRIHEDEFIIHRILNDSNKIIYIPIKLYYYRKRINSITTNKFSKKSLDKIDAFYDRVKFFNNLGLIELSERTQRVYLNCYLENYYKARRELNLSNKELKLYRHGLASLLRYILNNKSFNIKEKVMAVIITIYPDFYFINNKKL